MTLRGTDGQWAGGAYFPAHGEEAPDDGSRPWTATTYSLLQLRDSGIDQMRRSVALVRDNCRWEEGGQPSSAGEVEPCINGMAVGLGAYFGQDVDGVVTRPVGEQLDDGGWPRRSSWCPRKSSPTGRGCSRTHTPGTSTSSWRTVTVSPAGGTPPGAAGPAVV